MHTEPERLDSTDAGEHRVPLLGHNLGCRWAELTLHLALYMYNISHISSMHLMCTNMDHDKFTLVLEACQKVAIWNIIALQSNPSCGLR